MKKIIPSLIFVLAFNLACRASLTLTSSVINACAVGSGRLSVTATGGVSPYQYKMSGGSYQSSNTFTNLSSGSYTIYVMDNTGAVNSIVVSVGTIIHVYRHG